MYIYRFIYIYMYIYIYLLILTYKGKYTEASNILQKIISTYEKFKNSEITFDYQYDLKIDCLISKCVLDFADILNCLNRKGDSLIECKKVLIIRLNLLKIQNERDFHDLKIDRKNSRNIGNDYDSNIDFDRNGNDTKDIDSDDVYVDSYIEYGVRNYSQEMRDIMMLVAECYSRVGEHTYIYIHLYLLLFLSHCSLYT
jgi:hypothetical protein